MQVGVRVVSASVRNFNWDTFNKLPNTDQGPNYSRAKVAKQSKCGTMISLADWMSANADMIGQKRDEINKKIEVAKVRQRERNLLKKIRRELEAFIEDFWQPAAVSCERTRIAIDTHQKHRREHRNRTKVVRYGGVPVVKTETYTNDATKESEVYSYTELVGRIHFYRNHDSHGQHGRNPRYKDVPRGDEPKSSSHFRTKHVRHGWTGDLITTI